MFLPKDGDVTNLVIDTDGGWVQDAVTRKSVSSLAAFAGNCPLYDASVSQQVVSTSSGEAEWYAAVAATAKGLHLKGVLGSLIQQEIHLRIRTGSSVCKAIGNRRGIGRVKHLQVKSLWLQDVFKVGDAFLDKAGTKDNRADLGTKVLTEAEFDRLTNMNNVLPFAGCADFARQDVQKVGGII